jgi:hypothetical protein
MPHAFAYPGAFPKKRLGSALVESSLGEVALDRPSIKDFSSTENGNSQELQNSAENDGFISTTMLHMLHRQVAGSEDCNPSASARNTSQTVASRSGSEQSRSSFQSDTSTVPQSTHSQSSTAVSQAFPKLSLELTKISRLGLLGGEVFRYGKKTARVKRKSCHTSPLFLTLDVRSSIGYRKGSLMD